MREFFFAVQANPFYWAVLIFFAAYPVILSVVWITTGLMFYLRREGTGPTENESPPTLKFYPMVTVLIPTYCEESMIAETLTSATAIDYPHFEVVVVDDASTDRTVEIVRRFVDGGKVRLVAKDVNEGKAMALNDALPCINGEIILIMDADASPDPQILRWIVPHFETSRVAGVTGNPRVANRNPRARTPTSPPSRSRTEPAIRRASSTSSVSRSQFTAIIGGRAPTAVAPSRGCGDAGPASGDRVLNASLRVAGSERRSGSASS